MAAAAPLRRADVHPDVMGEATTSEMLRTFWPFTAGRRRRLVTALVVSLAQFAIAAALPLLTGHLLSAALHSTEGAASAELYAAVAWFVGAVMALAMVRLVAAALSQRALLGSGRRLQDEVFARVHDSVLVESGAIPRPSMVSRCTSYVDHVVKALREAAVSGIPAVMNLVLSMALLLWIEVRIGLAMLATVGLFEGARRMVTPSWSRTARELIDMSTAMGEVVDDSVTSERSTRLERAEPIERRRFAGRADQVRRASSKLGDYATNFDVGALVVGQFGVLVIAVIIGFGATDVSVSQATAAVLYAQAVAAAVAAIPPIVIHLQEAAPYMRRLHRVLLSPARWHEPPAPVVPPSTLETVDVVDLVSFDLDAHPVLRGATFSARRGSLTVVVGADLDEGDHLVRIVGGLEAPVSGAVTVDGVLLADIGSADVGRLVHVIPRFVTVFGTTFEENITLGRPTRWSIDEVVHRAALDEFVAGLHERVASPIANDRRRVSSEALARLGLARAVSSTAELIVIEDPSQLLDREAAHRWWHLVRAALDDRLVVMITDQVDVLGEDDQIVVMRSGAVAEVGSRHDLLESGRWFPELWKRWSSSAQAAHDLAALPILAGLDQGALESIASRMVTERYDADEPIFVAGDPADRVFIVLDGRVELTESGRRVGTVGPGGHFGDFAVSPQGASTDALRTTTARARGPVVVRSLHRLAVSSGVLGVLDRTPAEQRLYVQLTRRGECTLDDLRAAVPEVDVETTMASLVAAGLVVVGGADGTYRPASFARRPRLGADRLIT